MSRIIKKIYHHCSSGSGYILKRIRSKRYMLLLVFSLLTVAGKAQEKLSLLSWNLKDLGRSKSEQQIRFIAEIAKGYDLLAIQEVVAGEGGPDAVARLADELNRSGSKWDYEISEPTFGSSAHKSERYAYLWKTSKITKQGKGWLDVPLRDKIEREPFYSRFRVRNSTFVLVNFHAITKSAQPETEVKYFRYIPERYSTEKLIFCGDFNLPQSHSVFIPLLKMGFVPAMQGQKTSLRQRCLNGDCLASEFDNFFFDSRRIKLRNAGVILFYEKFIKFEQARKLTDHVPIFADLIL